MITSENEDCESIFISLHLQMAQAWRDPKRTDLCLFLCEKENGQESEAACQLGNFLFVQENFALTPALMTADWREESE